MKRSKKPRIRPLALCVFSHKGHYLLAEGYDPIKQETFYRPIGGKIEFGETAIQTLMREVMEEISAAATGFRYLGLLENIFTYNGMPGHEIVLIHDGRFTDTTLYDRAEIEGKDDDTQLFIARWLPLSYFEADNAPPLYPEGLLTLLKAQQSS